MVRPRVLPVGGVQHHGVKATFICLCSDAAGGMVGCTVTPVLRRALVTINCDGLGCVCRSAESFLGVFCTFLRFLLLCLLLSRFWSRNRRYTQRLGEIADSWYIRDAAVSSSRGSMTEICSTMEGQESWIGQDRWAFNVKYLVEMLSTNVKRDGGAFFRAS